MSYHNHDEETIKRLQEQTALDKKHKSTTLSNTSSVQDGSGVRNLSKAHPSYAIYLLETALRDEIIAKTDCENYLQGTHCASNTIGLEATRKAFIESGRIADERIPQLQKAISILSNETDN